MASFALKESSANEASPRPIVIALHLLAHWHSDGVVLTVARPRRHKDARLWDAKSDWPLAEP